ncbi:MAG: hypothetical protein M3256_01340 [Actinomycetota bacterium]|nr:hypothetical protein [Actinomycetota bacterium]
MATWQEFCGLAERFGGEKLNETAWRFELAIPNENRVQTVFVFYEMMRPDFEVIQVKSAFVVLSQLDLDLPTLLQTCGQMQVGAIGYSPTFEDDGSVKDGILNISTSIPLAALDLSDAVPFFLYLNILGQAADSLERKASLFGSMVDGF